MSTPMVRPLSVEQQVQRAPRREPLQGLQVAAVALLTVGSFLLRLVGIERESLWIDEGWSLWFSRLDFAVLWGDASKIELHPPLYYAVLKLWTSVWGESDFALRALSASISALTAPVVYLIARWVAPHRHHEFGLLAALLFELSAAQVLYSHEARGYTLLVFAMAVTLAASIAIVRNHFEPPTGSAEQPLRQPWAFVALGVAMALLVWSHNVGCLYAGVTALWMATFWLLATKASRKMFIGLLLSAVVFLVLVARPVWTLLFYTLGNASEFWLKAPDGYFLALQLSELFGAAFYTDGFLGELLIRVLLFGFWPVLTLLGAQSSQDPRIRWTVATVVALSYGLVLSNIIVTYAAKPIFMMRTILPAQVGWAVLTSLGLAFIPTAFRRAALGYLCAAFVAGLGSHYARRPLALHKRPWREALFEVAEKAEPNATIYTMANREPLTTHYLTAAGRSDLHVVPLPGPMAVPDVARCTHSITGCPFFTRSLTTWELQGVVSRLVSERSSWLILMEHESLVPNSLTDLAAVFRAQGATASWEYRSSFKDIFLYPPASRARELAVVH